VRPHLLAAAMQLLELTERGLLATEIAERYGRSVVWVRRLLKIAYAERRAILNHYASTGG
jgi:hypothetical protein